MDPERLPEDPERPRIEARTLPRDCSFALALFITGLVVNLFFSRMGFMPLDASIVFDGGWRILDGQVPWRDFTTPYGVVPAAMQAVFFAAAGQTWFAFCLHSSVVNGAFAVLLYLLLVILRLPRPLAFFYGLCATFFFYPPIGVPFLEQHSFFFTLAAITAAVGGNYAVRERVRWWLWGAVPPLVVLAFLSKQVPLVFAAPMLPVILLLPAPARLSTRLKGLAVGGAASAVLAALFAFVLRIPWHTFVEYTIARPRGVAGMRTSASELADRVLRRYDDLPSAMGLDFIGNAVSSYQLALIAFPILLAVSLFGRKRDLELPAEMSRTTCALLLAPATYVSSMLLGFVANNQTQNSIAFYPVGAGLLHAAMAAELRVLGRGLVLLPSVSGSVSGRQWLKRTVILTLVAVSIAPLRHWTLDTVTWVNRVVMPRMVNDMTFDFALAERSATSLPNGMAFIRWTPSPANYDLEAWTNLTNFLREKDGNFLIFGDTLVTYGLLGKPSVAPNLWFHPGLTLPDPSDPALAEYERELLDRIRRYNVGYIVIEGDATRLGFSTAHLPVLNAWLGAEWRLTHTFGVNRVYERVDR